MWRNKKSHTPQAVDSEAKIRQANQPPSPAPASWAGTAKTNKDVTRPARPTSWLGSSLHVRGEISGNEDLVIEGSVEGLIQLDWRKLTIGTTATVTADIISDELVVYGKLKGNVRAKGQIEIKKDGSVDGDLTTAQIMIEDGANFKGSIEIERSTEKDTAKNVFPPAA